MINPIFLNIIRGQAKTIKDDDLMEYKLRIDKIFDTERARRGI